MKPQVPLPFMLVSIAAVLVWVLTTIKVPDPVCNGKGFFESAQDLKVESVESKLISVKEVHKGLDYCIEYTGNHYTYAVNMSVKNVGSKSVEGFISVQFYDIPMPLQQFLLLDPESGYALDVVPVVIPVYVAIPAKTTKNIELVLSFEGDIVAGKVAANTNKSHQVAVIELGENIPDPTCDGTGELPLDKWIEVKMRK